MPVRKHASEMLRLVQITDSHLYAEPDKTLLGLPTAESLKAVVALVAREQPDIDLILATGDISQDGSSASYRAFVEQIKPLAAPMRWLSGNHDLASEQQDAAADSDWSQQVTDLPGWRIVMLDTSVPGAVHGELMDEQLATLETALQTAEGRHVLVGVHHHPVPVGSAWLDSLGLHNAQDLFAILDRYPEVRALLWGHIHQEVDQLRKDVRLLATPSTCIQFAPKSEKFALDTRLPGYRWLHLYADGRIETGVSRLESLDYSIDFSQNGY